MHIKALHIVLLTALFFESSLTTMAQSSKLFLKGGLSPVHLSGQNDFKSQNVPYQIGLQITKGHLTSDLSYHNGGSYLKENFSFKSSSIELGISYLLKRSILTPGINPFAGLAISYNTHKFTTEGYPGITSYTHKVETDHGIGLSVLLGFYYPLKKIILGSKAQFTKGSKASFLAGGFSGQELITDRFRLNITAAIPLNFISNNLKNAQLACPEY